MIVEDCFLFLWRLAFLTNNVSTVSSFFRWRIFMFNYSSKSKPDYYFFTSCLQMKFCTNAKNGYLILLKMTLPLVRPIFRYRIAPWWMSADASAYHPIWWALQRDTAYERISPLSTRAIKIIRLAIYSYTSNIRPCWIPRRSRCASNSRLGAIA